MERINQNELEALVNRQNETKLTETRSSQGYSEADVMLAGMLHMAASQAKTVVTPSEAQMWMRQVKGCSPKEIERFFAEWMANSHFMPGFADFTEWIEARQEAQARNRAQVEYEAANQRQWRKVEEWRNSPEYEKDMMEINRRGEELLAKARDGAKAAAKPPEIPLAFSPEKEKEIIAEYVDKRGA